jgi:RHS repeat-associated protein
MDPSDGLWSNPATKFQNEPKLGRNYGNSSKAGPSNQQPSESDSEPSGPLGSIVLPKSGGAISSVGEKFSVVPATGAASFTIPVGCFTSVGRASFAPLPALSYSTAQGNGPLGFGWSLPLGAITRKTDKGIPQYRDDIEGIDVLDEDIFLFSGVEDLVPELSLSPAGTWTRSPPQTAMFNNVNYFVYSYRPRVESSMVKIERWSAVTDIENTHWRVISTSNITSWYGLTSESRIFDPLNPQNIFSWLLCESRDNMGNRYIVEYKPEDSTGVDLTQSNERNRTPQTRGVNRYLKRISYGNRTSTLVSSDNSESSDVEWMFKAVFDYGEHDLNNPTPNNTGPWLVRRDPFSSYRSGFEVRTYRLCQRILMFHNFPDEPAVGADCLVKSTNITYGDVRGNTSTVAPNLGSVIATFISSISTTCYRRNGSSYDSNALPPVEYKYTAAEIDSTIHDADPESLENLPYGIDDNYYQMVDLNGEGAMGVLTQTSNGSSWMYKSPLGHGRFGQIERLPTKPNLSNLEDATQFLKDVDGSGTLDVCYFNYSLNGFTSRTFEQDSPDWAPFEYFRYVPNISWNDPNLRSLDLTGDGIADILVTEGESFTWYESLGKEGFRPGERLYTPDDDEAGPRLLFSDELKCVFLADMSGDGLVDLVRARCGEVCYWPNKGYGHFGTKVTMDNAPWNDHWDTWDARRVRFADVDGSGPTDLIYLGQAGVSIYFNQAGNGWSSEQLLPVFPKVDNLSTIQVVDLFGNGTSCLVWSSGWPDRQKLRYVDLMGTKPNLIVSMVNNLGGETKVHYAASTKFYLEDKAAGKPWISRVPFPIQLVEIVEVFDRIGRTYSNTRYAYHHGYFDGVEREFRGFGMIEQWDLEELDVLGNASIASTTSTPVNLNSQFNVPPVHTKTWFHTGLWRGDGHISRYFEKDYWQESGNLDSAKLKLMQLSDAQLPNGVLMLDGTTSPHQLFADEAREASRALSGTVLRVEVYSTSGDPATQAMPYHVSESSPLIVMLQPKSKYNRYSVFRVMEQEGILFNYDRHTLVNTNGNTVCSPRVSHNLNLEFDQYGNATRIATVSYGQRYPEPDPNGILNLTDKLNQQKLVVTYSEFDFTNAILTTDTNCQPLAFESRQYELVKAKPATSDPEITNLFTIDVLRAAISQASDGSHDLLFEDYLGSGAIQNQPYRRLVNRSRKIYQADDLSTSLPLGTTQTRAIVYQTLTQASTPQILTETYVTSGKFSSEAALEDTLTNECKYVHSEGDTNWWVPSGRTFYSPNSADTSAEELAYALSHFFTPLRYRDQFYSASFDTETFITYDNYTLLPIETIDAFGNRMSNGERDPDPTKPFVRNGLDYRLLTTSMSMEPNRNMQEYAFDIYGNVVGSAVMGKPGDNEGDNLQGFVADLTDAQISSYLSDPLTIGPQLLGNASARIIFDIWAYYQSTHAPTFTPEPVPAVTSVLARVTHVSDLQAGATTDLQYSFHYADGFGRVIQSKSQTDAGPVPSRDPTTGEVILNDGVPEMTTTPVSPRWLGTGWTVYNNKGLPVQQYEPFFTDRLTFEFDVRIGVSPTAFYDPLGRIVAVLNGNKTWSKTIFNPWREETWDLNDTAMILDPKSDPDVGEYCSLLPDSDFVPTWWSTRQGGALGAEEQKAAQKTEMHANTPSFSYFDSVGNMFLTVAHNKYLYSNAPAGTVPTEEFYTSRVVMDIQGNIHSYLDSAGRTTYQDTFSMLGEAITHSTMDMGSRSVLSDVLGRALYVWDGRGNRFRSEYDESSRPVARHELLSGATTEVISEKTAYGDLDSDAESLNLRTRVRYVYDQSGKSSNLLFDFKGNILSENKAYADHYSSEIDWNASPTIEKVPYTNSITYDALDRPLTITLADKTVLYPGYDLQNRINHFSASLQGSSTRTLFVQSTSYTALGQRSSITYGNNVATTATFDYLTNRLQSLLTKRPSAQFPNDSTNPPPSGWPGVQIQNLSYTCDPVGNVISTIDSAQQSIFFRGTRVDPNNAYLFDAVYRLLEATGREHLGQTNGSPNGPTPFDRLNKVQTGLSPNSGDVLGIYLEQYRYDNTGNILSLRHIGSDPQNSGWTRNYQYQEPSQLEPAKLNNRLSSTTVGAVTEQYGYDNDAGIHGNITSMSGFSSLNWDNKDQLQSASVQVVNNGGSAETTYYVYDSGGSRVRKVTERQASPGVTPTRKSETRYLGGMEIYFEYANDGITVTLQRNTTYIVDGNGKIALVETFIQGTQDGSIPNPQIRYQFSTNMGSVSIELDDTGQVISYEEYTPFGSTSYQAVRSLLGAPKRYRYIGRERDVETGFSYHGSRYYLPWLGRWLSADPQHYADGPNVFAYCRNNPVTLCDPGGMEAQEQVSAGITITPEEQEQIKNLKDDKNKDPIIRAAMLRSNWEAKGGHIVQEGDHFRLVGGTISRLEIEEVTVHGTKPSKGSPPTAQAATESAAAPGPGSGAGAAPEAPAATSPSSGPAAAAEGEKAAPEERSFWSRGGKNLAFGLGAVALGTLAVLAGPVGWLAIASAGMLLGSGIFGVAASTNQLVKSYSGKTTAAEDEKANERISTIMTVAGSPGGLIGGAIGAGYSAATGGDVWKGAQIGGMIGGIAEAGIYITKGVGTLVANEVKFGRGTANMSRWSNVSKAVKEDVYELEAAQLRRPNASFPRGIERQELAHSPWFPRRNITAGKEWLYNRPWNLRLMWGSEHAVVDAYRWNFMPRAWKALNPMKNPIFKYYHETPLWAVDVGTGLAKGGQVGSRAAGDKQ